MVCLIYTTYLIIAFQNIATSLKIKLEDMMINKNQCTTDPYFIQNGLILWEKLHLMFVPSWYVILNYNNNAFYLRIIHTKIFVMKPVIKKTNSKGFFFAYGHLNVLF